MHTDALAERIHNLTGQRVERIRALSGGCVGDVYRVTLAGGERALGAKVDDGPPCYAGGLAREGRMLRYLAHHTDVPVPEVLSADDTVLLMTYIEADGRLSGDAERHAAQIIAALHAITTDAGFGFDEDTVIGGLPQPNPWSPSWRSFFAEHRLIYMSREGERVGRLPSALLARVERFAGALERWIDEPAQPSLIHGDLWGGNILAAHGRITGLIDPAIYFADPEIELAFSTLFGTFGDAFFGPYNELRPIRAGFFEERRDLYNLYPLLVHVRLFGGSYVASVERTLARFGY